MLLRRLSFLIVLACSPAQTAFPATEVAELRDLYWDQESAGLTAPVGLGLAHVIFESRDVFRVEGVDDRGLPWRAWIPNGGGAHRVYRADFDANGRDDLLFATAYGSNGRCVEGGVLTSFLFNGDGRPMPWSMKSQGMLTDMPVTLLDLNGDGRAELVTSNCEYADQMREKRWLSGVYEARMGRWTPIAANAPSPYLAAAKERYLDYDWADWAEPPSQWFDPLEGWGQRPRVELAGIVGGEIGCPTYDDPDSGCEPGAGLSRLHFSDDSVRLLPFGGRSWPAVVADGPSGRSMYLAEPYKAVEQTLAQQLDLRALGPLDSPAVLWLEGDLELDPNAARPKFAMRILLSSKQREPIALIEGNPQPPGARAGERYFDANAFIPPRKIIPNSQPSPSNAPNPASAPAPPRSRRSGRYFSRGEKCFFHGDDWRSQEVYSLASCELLGELAAEAQGGGTVFENGKENPLVVKPGRGTVVIWGDSAGALVPERELLLRSPPSISGELVAAVRFQDDWLAQWSDTGRQWLVMHDNEGAPVSPEAALGEAAELLEVSRRGFTFLRWEADLPVEVIHVRAAIEWVRE